MKRTRRWISRGAAALVAGAVLLACGREAAAQGWIEPGVDRTGFAVDRVRSEVRVVVSGRVAQVEVSEWFVNRGPRLAEGDYLYPLAGEAVFQGFSLFQGETELRGEIMDADRARRIYEEIVRRRADPALIELAGEGLLRARVFPIQPGETRKVSLRYTQLLERAGNALEFQYAGGVRGGERGTAHSADPSAQARTRFEIEVDDCELFLDPFSPTHGLDVERRGDRMTVSVRDEMVGRLAVFLPLAGDAIGLSVATHRPVGEAGYFMLTLSPDAARGARQPRDVTVVMDVSGSMSGEKIEQARAALHQLLGTLSADDRFRLLSFSSDVRSFDRGWTEASGRPLERARAWIDRLEADGGTNIEGALEEAFRVDSPRERLPVVVFLTDGLPSVGSESPEELASIAERHAGRARVFAFGVGNDVNTRLLDRLGEAGRGDTDYVRPGENVERALSLLAAKIRHPVLTELRLEGGPVDLDEVYPVRIPDIFAGQELVLFGRFDGEGQGQITVAGERAGRDLEFSTELIFPEASEANAYIPRLWASRKLGHLERQVWTEGMTESLGEEIRTLALRYGLPSRYTAYLVEEPGIVANGPAGGVIPLRGSTSGGSGRGSVVPAAAPVTGASAVQAAESARRMRATASMDDLAAAENELAKQALASMDASLPTQMIAGRLFVLRDGVWTDGAHSEQARLVRVRVYSEAWFALAAALPELSEVLEKHESVVIAAGDLSLQVGDEGVERLSRKEVDELVAGIRHERVR